MALHDVVIIGSGPVGLTAAIYTTRANLKTLVLAGSAKGGDPTRIPGGQLMATTAVENYPGFPDGVQGPELMDLVRRQAARFGAEIVDTNAVAVDFQRHPFRIRSEEGEHEGRTVVVGGGDSAMEDSLFLSKLCKSVKVIHRRDGFRASKIMQDRLLHTPNVEVVWNTEGLEILGGDKVSEIGRAHV